MRGGLKKLASIGVDGIAQPKYGLTQLDAEVAARLAAQLILRVTKLRSGTVLDARGREKTQRKTELTKLKLKKN